MKRNEAEASAAVAAAVRRTDRPLDDLARARVHARLVATLDAEALRRPSNGRMIGAACLLLAAAAFVWVLWPRARAHDGALLEPYVVAGALPEASATDLLGG
jgi:hypothetical protein